MGKYRGNHHRPSHPKIFVWSHTEKAEIEYFLEFKHFLRTPLLMPQKEILWTPQELIEHVIKWKKKNISAWSHPSENLKKYVYAKRKDTDWEIRNYLVYHKTFFSCDKQYLKMSFECGIHSDIKSTLDVLNIMESQWNDLSRVADGTVDKEIFDKSILGKAKKIYNYIC